MALTNAFHEAVASGNVRRVRIMMQDSLLVDPTFKEFEAMRKAAASMAGLYDEHDGKELVTDRSLWNNEYMDKVMVKVLSNFSQERIEHLKEVVRYLRPVTETVTPKRETRHVSEHRRGRERGDDRGFKIAGGAVAGAAAGGLLAFAAGASVKGVIGGVVAGAVVAGVVTALIVNGGEE